LPTTSVNKPMKGCCLCCSQRSCFRCFFNNNTLGTAKIMSNKDVSFTGKNDEVLVEFGKSGDAGNMEMETNEEVKNEGLEGLLGRLDPSDEGRKCLVLDLDETLVHSSFIPVDCSFCVSVELDGNSHDVYVKKRPFVDEFIAECAKTYELVIFTASLSEYANPVIDRLDTTGVIKHRLFRENCVIHEGQFFVKDLSRLGRNLKDCIIIDNSPLSYLFDSKNAIGCTTWLGNQTDTELRDLLPVLNGVLSTTEDVRHVLSANEQTINWLISKHGESKHLVTISE